MPERSYDLLAVDLDGTLFGPDGRVSQINRDAVERAREAGLEIVLCTGRGLPESVTAIDAVDARIPTRGREEAPVVTAGGAMVCDAASWSTLHRWPMEESLIIRMCDHFAALQRAPLLFKDRDAAGFDYLVIDSGPLEEPTRWWFEAMDVQVKFAANVRDDPHPEHTVRLGFAAHTPVMLELGQSIKSAFGDEAVIHHFAAVNGSVGGAHGTKDNSVHLLEVFDRQVSKWTAVHRIALEQGIARDRIAAIGDEINDLAMIEGAALGIAMGNAVDEIKSAASVVAPSHADDGVAFAIDNILDARW